MSDITEIEKAEQTKNRAKHIYTVALRLLQELHEVMVTWKSRDLSGDVSEHAIFLVTTMCDGVNRKFKFAVDLFLKYLTLYLEQQGYCVLQQSSRDVFQLALNRGVISVEEFYTLLHAMDKRNRIFKSYPIEMAEELAENVPDHYAALNTVIKRLKIE
jgi:hypothetical protein